MKETSWAAAPKVPLFLIGTILLACACGYRGFLELFTRFAAWDDTGYMLSLIQGFNEYGGLYRRIFSQYGPFYSEFYFVIGNLLGIPITQDGIRWLVLALWIACSLIGSFLAFRLTGLISVSLLAQLLCFHVLDQLRTEPGHPISLAAVCLGLLALSLTGWGTENPVRSRTFIIGLLLGILMMVKINLGVFALAAIGTAWIYSSPLDSLGKALRCAVALVFCLLPMLIVKTPWALELRINFIALFVCASVAVLVAAREQTFEWPAFRRFGLWIFAGLILSCTIALAGVILSGTRAADLINGIIVQPMRLATAFWVPPMIDARTVATAVASLLTAFGWRLLVPVSPMIHDRISFGLRLFFLALLAAWFARLLEYWTVFPWLWIAVLPPRGHAHSGFPRLTDFGRLSVGLLAVSQFLGVYPVSGAQVILPMYLGCLSSVLVMESLLAELKSTDHLQIKPSHGRILLSTVTIACALVVARSSFHEGRRAWTQYRKSLSLGLPGAELLRIERSSAATYRFLAENLRECRPSFVTIPGLNSLYGWSERPWPTGFNATMNFVLLPQEEQRQIVKVGLTCEPIALVLNRELMNFWTRGHFQPSGPLIDFMTKNCRAMGRVGDYELMSLIDSPGMPLTYCATLDREWRSSGREGQITVSLPARFDRVATASLLQTSSDQSLCKLVKIELTSEDYEEPKKGGANGTRRLKFQLPDRELLSLTSLDGILVQLWDDGGRLILDVPFLRLPEDR